MTRVFKPYIKVFNTLKYFGFEVHVTPREHSALPYQGGLFSDSQGQRYFMEHDGEDKPRLFRLEEVDVEITEIRK